MKNPTPPRGLSSESRELWKKLNAEFSFGDAASFALLTQLCETLDRLRECQAQIQKDGLTVKGSTGQRRPHPLLAVEDQCRRTLLAVARALKLDLATQVL